MKLALGLASALATLIFLELVLSALFEPVHPGLAGPGTVPAR